MGILSSGKWFVESSLGPTLEVGGSALGYDIGTNGLKCPMGLTWRLGQAPIELSHRRGTIRKTMPGERIDLRETLRFFFSHATRLALSGRVGLGSIPTGATNSLASQTNRAPPPLWKRTGLVLEWRK